MSPYPNFKLQKTGVAVVLSALVVALPLQAQEKLTFDQPETMGMSMFRAHWDTPVPLAADGATTFWDGVAKDKRERGAYAVWTKDKRGDKPGALAFDALNRSLLVRFPEKPKGSGPRPAPFCRLRTIPLTGFIIHIGFL